MCWAALGLSCCMQTLFLKLIYYVYVWLCWSSLLCRLFSSCGEQGLRLVVVSRLLIASLVVEHGCVGFSCWGSRALDRQILYR